ncbi:oxidoreductase [Fusarium napiforme]|uniref:Oxidoreductase n=1 Tax=Fusarium napiforme TaxID=42672 RepID=A0A8H5IC47_9HYPO|nr:oxidoreductase [Fusarium napiforme]
MDSQTQDVRNDLSKIQLERIAHVYFEHSNLDKFDEIAKDFGLIPVCRDANQIFYRGFGKDLYCYVARRSLTGLQSSSGGAFVAQSDFDKAAALEGDVVSDLSSFPGGGHQITLKSPSGFLHGEIQSKNLLQQSAQRTQQPRRRTPQASSSVLQISEFNPLLVECDDPEDEFDALYPPANLQLQVLRITHQHPQIICRTTIDRNVYPGLCLTASRIASFIHACGIKHADTAWKKYINPMRDLGTFADWIEGKKELGIKVLFVGADVKRWLNRIKRPWSDEWRRPYPIMIWPAVVRSDGSDSLDELRQLERLRLDNGDRDMHEDLTHTGALVENFLGISDIHTTRYLQPPMQTGHVRMGTNHWSVNDSFHTDENGIKLVFWCGYISDNGPMAVGVDHHSNLTETTCRERNELLVEPTLVAGIPVTEMYMSQNDPGRFKLNYVDGVPEWYGDRQRLTDEDQIVIRVSVMNQYSSAGGSTIMRENVIRVSMRSEFR